MSMHSVRKCPVCGGDTGLFLDSTQKRSIFQCENKHRFRNEKGTPGMRVADAPSTRIQFKYKDNRY